MKISASPMLRPNGYRVFSLGNCQFLFRPRTVLIVLCLLVVVVACFVYILPLGSYGTERQMVWRVFSDIASVPAEQAFIIRDIRLPRILMAMLCGASLGIAGAAMQSVTRNGLADPGLIGVKEGASVAVLAVILNFPAANIFWRPFIGMAGGITVALLVAVLARDLAKARFVLIGIGVSWFFAAGISFFVTTASVREVQTALIWLAGSLHTSTWATLSVTAVWSLLGATVIAATARSSDAALLGDQTGGGLGINLRRLLILRFAAPVVLTAASVSAIGNVGFVGLIAPHVARMIVGSAQSQLLAGSALIGALLLLGADSIGRVLFSPTQIPAGIVMAVIGVPFFLLLLWMRRDRL